MSMFKLFKKKKPWITIEERSNIIQFDGMGYPLRLCITNQGQMWIDTDKQDGDVVLRWEKESAKGQEIIATQNPFNI